MRVSEKRDVKQPPQQPTSCTSEVTLAKLSVVATEGVGTTGVRVYPSRKLLPFPVEVENRAPISLPEGKEHPVIPRDRDVRNNASQLKERQSFSKDKDSIGPTTLGGGWKLSVSPSDRDDSGVGTRHSSSYREGRRSSFSSDNGDARRPSFGVDNKGDGKRKPV